MNGLMSVEILGSFFAMIDEKKIYSNKQFYQRVMSDKLRPPPLTQKKSVFVKKIEMEIKAWEDSLKSALSETLWLSIKYPIFG
jgi:hypothetical protein